MTYFRLFRVSLLACLLCVFLFPASLRAAPEKPAENKESEAPANEPDIERMLGCMLMLGFRGASLADGDPFLQMLKAGKIGNVILFDKDVTDGGQRNIISPEQLRSLTSTLRKAAPGPLFIAIDQEGGQVRRLKPQKGFFDLPSAQSLGQGNPAATFETAAQLGDELRDLGINLDLAPVVDVDTNPFNPAIGRLARSFGPDPAQVSAHALAFGRGLAKSGVAPCLKHFPGQGCAAEDSHLGLPDISQCWDPEIDLAPYAEIFKAGWPGMVMVGHLFHSSLDDKQPATLSRKIVTGLLREGFGWNGVVISDDLQMKAIAQEKDLEEVFREAIEAGIDILMLGNNLAWYETIPQRAWAALRSLYEKGALSEERIRQSWSRIDALHNAYKAQK